MIVVPVFEGDQSQSTLKIEVESPLSFLEIMFALECVKQNTSIQNEIRRIYEEMSRACCMVLNQFHIRTNAQTYKALASSTLSRNMAMAIT